MKFIRGSIYSILWLLTSCSSIEESENQKIKQGNESKEVVYRSFSDVRSLRPGLRRQVRDPYPWEPGYMGVHAKITKEMFRCKGGSKNPSHSKKDHPGQLVCDCRGKEGHSLPIHAGKEFIYPVLLELVNYIQMKSSCRVVITCGHRCPVHNGYADPSIYNLSSKHMIGAEVDFYVEGMETRPLEVIDLIMRYYKEKETYRDQKDYRQFQRLESVKLNVETPPWYNKEILVKLYKEEEGRDFDNQHPYPYISIQVKFDKEKNEKVLYSWEKAFQGYMRY